jgi:hypothetical protein
MRGERRPTITVFQSCFGAAAARLRAEALEEFLNTWERKHGTLTAAQLSQAEGELGVGAPKKSRQ